MSFGNNDSNSEFQKAFPTSLDAITYVYLLFLNVASNLDFN